MNVTAYVGNAEYICITCPRPDNCKTITNISEVFELTYQCDICKETFRFDGNLHTEGIEILDQVPEYLDDSPFGERYGSETYDLTQEQIDSLVRGSVIALDVLHENVVYIRKKIKQES